MKWFDAVRARLCLLFARRAAESRMNLEFRLHLDLETEQRIARGLAPDEARRQALVAFGGVETHKETLRVGRGLAWLGGFALDLKLAARLLARYPWLTIVGGAAMAFGFAAGVGGFEIRTQFVNPSLPLEEGSRIVGVRHWDALRAQAAAATLTFVALRESAPTGTEAAMRAAYSVLMMGVCPACLHRAHAPRAACRTRPRPGGRRLAQFLEKAVRLRLPFLVSRACVLLQGHWIHPSSAWGCGHQPDENLAETFQKVTESHFLSFRESLAPERLMRTAQLHTL